MASSLWRNWAEISKFLSMGLDPNSIMYLRFTPVCFKQPHLCTSSIKDFLEAMKTRFWRQDPLNLRLNWNTNPHVTQAHNAKNIEDKNQRKFNKRSYRNWEERKWHPFCREGEIEQWFGVLTVKENWVILELDWRVKFGPFHLQVANLQNLVKRVTLVLMMRNENWYEKYYFKFFKTLIKAEHFWKQIIR